MNPTHVMGRRVVAFIIDYVLLVAAFTGLFYALATHTTEAVQLTGSHVNVTFDRDTYYLVGDDVTIFYVIALAIGLLYAGVIQGLTGATIGKLICGIRVMREDGSRPGIGRGVLRWVLLIVDDFPYFIPMLTGFIVAMTNDRRRRVGDMAAGTFVVRAGVAGVPVPNGVQSTVAAPPPGAWPPAPDPAFRQSAAGATAAQDANRTPPAAPAAPAAPAPETAPPTQPTPAAAPPDQPTAPQPQAAPEPPKPAPEPEPDTAAQPSAEPAAQPSAPEPAAPGPPPFPSPAPARAPAPAPTPQPPRPVAPPMPPANWYPDPSGHARLRYWDGARWTDHTAQ